MRALIERVFVAGLGPAGAGLAAMDDGAAIAMGDGFLVLTTDSYVIKPLFFPGGDIGRLAISGTINDLAMMGATEPLGLTCAVIIETGFPIADLERIRDSMRATCTEAGAAIVTGDTKVMGKGELDGLVINTAGVAFARRWCPILACDAEIALSSAEVWAITASQSWRRGTSCSSEGRWHPTWRHSTDWCGRHWPRAVTASAP